MMQDPEPRHFASVPSGAPVPPAPPAPDHDELLAWLAGWGAEVAAVDLAAGYRRFSPGVSAFGTHADVVIGLDRLFAEQWSQVWPTIEDFRFESTQAQVIESPDRLQAVIVVPWGSTGIAADGSRFDRPGRATVVLTRAALDDPWVGVHTHFSLARGVPASSHGARAATTADPAGT